MEALTSGGVDGSPPASVSATDVEVPAFACDVEGSLVLGEKGLVDDPKEKAGAATVLPNPAGFVDWEPKANELPVVLPPASPPVPKEKLVEGTGLEKLKAAGLAGLSSAPPLADVTGLPNSYDVVFEPKGNAGAPDEEAAVVPAMLS